MPTAQERVAAPRRTASKLTAPKLASARKRTGRAAVAEPPAPKAAREEAAPPAAQPAPSQGKTQVWIPGSPLPGVTPSPAAGPAPSPAPAPRAGAGDHAVASPVTGNTLRGTFGGAVAAAFTETFGETPPHARGGQDAGAQTGDAPDMNTVVETGPPAALRAQAAQDRGAPQPGPQPAPVRGGKTQIWGGGALPPAAGARPVASAGAASTPGPAAASFQTDVAFPDADRDRARGSADGHAPTNPEATSPPMKTTVGLPPTGPSLLAAAEAARATADAARAADEQASAAPVAAPTSAPAEPAQPTPAPAQPAPAASPAQAPAPTARPKPPPDFRQAAEHGFTRQGRAAPKGGSASVWIWVAAGVAVLAIALALALSQ